MTQWTIRVEQSVNNYAHGHGRKNIEWTDIRLVEMTVKEYRSDLDDIADSVFARKESEWKEIVASGPVEVSESGIMSLISLCGDNEAFMTEFNELLEKVWFMGRAYERNRLKQRNSDPDPKPEEIVGKRSIEKAA